MRQTFRRGASAAICALLLASGAALGTASAHAGDNDDRFIEHLDLKRVPYTNRTQVIRAAKDFCVARTRQNEPKFRAAYRVMQDMGWTETEAGYFVEAAIPIYCPKVWN